MSDKKLNFCERLKKLMTKNGYKNAAELSRAFFQTGIKKYTENKKTTHIEQEHNLKDQINTHLRQPEFGKVSLKNISLYCRLFECSSDYLLGVIDYPTYEIKSVSEQTGLSEIAIDKLRQMKQADKTTALQIISDLLTNPLFNDILSQFIDLYCMADLQKSPSLDALSEVLHTISDRQRKLANKADKDHVQLTKEELTKFGLDGKAVARITHLLSKEDAARDKAIAIQEISRLSGNLAESFYKSHSK